MRVSLVRMADSFRHSINNSTTQILMYIHPQKRFQLHVRNTEAHIHTLHTLSDRTTVGKETQTKSLALLLT